MAVYEGARPRPGLGSARPLPVAGPAARPVGRRLGLDRPALPRRRARVAVRAGRRPSRIGLALGGIVLAFLLGFFSLVQTISVSASGYDVDQIQAQETQFQAQSQQLQSDLSRLGGEPAIRKLAIDGGLAQLGEPLVVPAR